MHIWRKRIYAFWWICKITKSKSILNSCKKHKSIDGFLFCISCEKWLCDSCFLWHKERYPKHLYNKIPIRLREYCHRHEKEQAVGYCKNCAKNVCENCKIGKIKLRHDLFNFDDEDNIAKCDKKWNSFIDLQILHSTKNEKSNIMFANNIKYNFNDLKNRMKLISSRNKKFIFKNLFMKK